MQTLTQEVITTSAIEGEALNLDAVRSCVARRLGVDMGALAPADRNINDLLARGALRRLEGGGRSTGYWLVK